MADDIAQWLEGLGLGRYAEAFAENDIDLRTIPHLSDEDLKALGLSLGHRRLIQGALKAEPTPPPGPAEPTRPGAPAEAERRQLTVVFADLVGSTALAAKLDPEDMREVIRAYQDACARVVARYDGYVAKFMGDGAYVYFGYPRAHEDDAERAVNAGLGIVEAVTALGRDLHVRIGIATGTVAVGDIVGQGAAEEANVVGEAPNLAARLQELAKPGTVVIGESTHALAGSLFDCDDLDARPLKGFSEPHRAWRVIRPRRAESRFDVMRATGLTALVGREEELDMLVRRWRRAKEGEGQVALVSGEPGIGKSRLVHALQERIVDDPHTPVRLQCSPFHTNSALHPMIDYIERAADLTSNDGTTAKLDKLEALLRQSGDRIDEVAPLMAELLSIPTGDRYPPLRMSPQEKKLRTLRLMTGRLLALAALRPLLLVLEDAHWIDPTTLELMELIVDGAAEAAVFAVISFRPEFAAPWVGRPRVTLLALNRLDQLSSALMVNEVVAGRILSDGVREQIIARTDGIPLFVEELTRSVLEAGPSAPSHGDVQFATPAASVDIPATLMDSLEARIDRLGPAKPVAQLGATIGRSFDYALLSEIASLTDAELGEALDRLVASGLVIARGEPPNATYAFKHALIEDAAYGSLLRGRREETHSRIAQALEQRISRDASVEPELIAHHLTAARQYETAVRYWLMAGEAAFNRSTLQEAIAHLRKGLEVNDCLPEGEGHRGGEIALQATLGVTLKAYKGMGHEDAERAFARAHELGRHSNESSYGFPVLFGLWHAHVAQAQALKGHSESKELLAMAEASGDRQQLLAANWARGWSSAQVGENGPSLDFFERAEDLYEPEADAPLAFKYLVEFGVGICFGSVAPLFAIGYPDRALRMAHKAISRGRAQLFVHLGAAFNYGAHVPICRGEPETVLAWSEECIEFAAARDIQFHAAFGRINHGWALVQLERVAEGISEIREGIQGWRASGYENWAPWHLIVLAEAQISAGRPDEALQSAEEALESIRRTGERQFESPALIVNGDALIAKDRAEQSERCYREAIDVARAQSAKSWELRAATRLARRWGSQGKAAEARDLLAPVYGWFTEGFETADLKDAKALLDEIG